MKGSFGLISLLLALLLIGLAASHLLGSRKPTAAGPGTHPRSTTEAAALIQSVQATLNADSAARSANLDCATAEGQQCAIPSPAPSATASQ